MGRIADLVPFEHNLPCAIPSNTRPQQTWFVIFSFQDQADVLGLAKWGLVWLQAPHSLQLSCPRRQLPYIDTFNTLGMVCDKTFNLDVAADAALRPFTAGTFQVKKFVQEHDLANR
eukprot:1147704-Pelagomonas_calceolata.AAC.2